jgi:hypothetical protein
LPITPLADWLAHFPFRPPDHPPPRYRIAGLPALERSSGSRTAGAESMSFAGDTHE